MHHCSCVFACFMKLTFITWLLKDAKAAIALICTQTRLKGESSYNNSALTRIVWPLTNLRSNLVLQMDCGTGPACMKSSWNVFCSFQLTGYTENISQHESEVYCVRLFHLYSPIYLCPVWHEQVEVSRFAHHWHARPRVLQQSALQRLLSLWYCHFGGGHNTGSWTSNYRVHKPVKEEENSFHSRP